MLRHKTLIGNDSRSFETFRKVYNTQAGQEYACNTLVPSQKRCWKLQFSSYIHDCSKFRRARAAIALRLIFLTCSRDKTERHIAQLKANIKY